MNRHHVRSHEGPGYRAWNLDDEQIDATFETVEAAKAYTTPRGNPMRIVGPGPNDGWVSVAYEYHDGPGPSFWSRTTREWVLTAN